jgi:iron complex transport system substrate-binding protein
LTITDDSKRSIKFDKVPSKIVSLAPSNTELVYALGLGDKLVGVDEFSNYPEEAKQKEKVGGYNDTNIERVVALNTDLVLASTNVTPQLITSLEGRGLKVVVLNPPNLAGVVANIKLLAQIANVLDKGEQLAGDFQKKLDDVAAKVKNASTKPKVFYELDPTLFTVGPGSFVDDMIQKAGGQNIVTDASNPFPQLSQEAVVAKDPDVILVTVYIGGGDTPDKVLSRPGWENISAVKNKRVYGLDADIVSRPGPRAAQGVELIAKALYPDLFK